MTAYYLDYQEKRNEYVNGFFDRLVNWKFAEKNLKHALTLRPNNGNHDGGGIIHQVSHRGLPFVAAMFSANWMKRNAVHWLFRQ